MRKFTKTFRERTLLYRWAIFAFLITVLVSFLIYLFGGDTFQENFYSNLLATCSGVILGIPLTLLIGVQLEEKQSSQKRMKICTLLRREIEINLDQIGNWRVVEDKTDRLTDTAKLSVSIKLELWQAFSDSGELKWIDEHELMDKLSEAYYLLGGIKNLSALTYDIWMARDKRSTDMAGRTFRQLETFVYNSADQLHLILLSIPNE